MFLTKGLCLFVILIHTLCMFSPVSADGIKKDSELSDILKRLDKLETENKALKIENEAFKRKLHGYEEKQKNVLSILTNVLQSTTTQSSQKNGNSNNLETLIELKQNKTRKRLLVDTPDGAVAFNAGLTKSISSVGVHQAIEYDNVPLNLGNAYDARHGHFTAPVKGLYVVMANAFSDPSKRLVLEIVKNGNVLAVLDTGLHTSYTSNEKSFPVVLEQNDMVWIRTPQSFAGEYIHAYRQAFHNMFAAVLITTL